MISRIIYHRRETTSLIYYHDLYIWRETNQRERTRCEHMNGANAPVTMSEGFSQYCSRANEIKRVTFLRI